MYITLSMHFAAAHRISTHKYVPKLRVDPAGCAEGPSDTVSSAAVSAAGPITPGAGPGRRAGDIGRRRQSPETIAAGS